MPGEPAVGDQSAISSLVGRSRKSFRRECWNGRYIVEASGNKGSGVERVGMMLCHHARWFMVSTTWIGTLDSFASYWGCGTVMLRKVHIGFT